MKKSIICVMCIMLCAVPGGAFGFGFDDDDEAPAQALSVALGGEIGSEFLGYVYDFDKEKIDESSLGEIVSGSLNFSASGANVDAYIGLNLSPRSLYDLTRLGSVTAAYTPLILDEAYLRAFFGPVNIEAGYRKLVWGKADSLGPLDIINPLDYSDLTNITDIQAIKIARPMVRLTWNTGGFSKLEAVFVPNFAGHRFASSGRWTPSQVRETTETVNTVIREWADDRAQFLQLMLPPEYAALVPYLIPAIISQINFSDFSQFYPDTSGLKYFQTGLRYTATVGSVDIGGQYFYGNLFQPAVNLSAEEIEDYLNELLANNLQSDTPGAYTGNPDFIRYNRFHQIGIDYAQVLFGFNLRAEFAAHITEDLSGDDGKVINPFLAWSFGFDREIVAGISANIQCTETIRLLNNKIGSDKAKDFEAGTAPTATRLTMMVSKSFLKGDLETKLMAIWDIENSDCYIIPSLTWAIKDVKAELCAGVFTGKESGELGQYWENAFVKIGLKYSF